MLLCVILKSCHTRKSLHGSALRTKVLIVVLSLNHLHKDGLSFPGGPLLSSVSSTCHSDTLILSSLATTESGLE